MRDFGLVQVDPKKTLLQVEQVLDFIRAVREEAEQEGIETVRKKYLNSFWYRFFKVSEKDAFKPCPNPSREFILKIIKDNDRYSLWNQYASYRKAKVNAVRILCEQAILHNTDVYLNEHHIQALFDKNYMGEQ